MLQITIPATKGAELWDERTETFVTLPGTKEQTLQLEHSLVSLSKWESRWRKPFISTKEKTYEETLDYIKCMTITQNVKPEVYQNITDEQINEINRYIDDPMTATTFSEGKPKKGKREVVTAEIIYWWMIALDIDLEWEKRHLNRLITLIRVCSIKNQPAKKRSTRDLLSSHAAMNMARRQKFYLPRKRKRCRGRSMEAVR